MNFNLHDYYFIEVAGGKSWLPCLSNPDGTALLPCGFFALEAAQAAIKAEHARYGGEYRIIRHNQFTIFSAALPRGWGKAYETEPGRWAYARSGVSNHNERFVAVAGVLIPFRLLDVSEWAQYAPIIAAMRLAGLASAPIVDAKRRRGEYSVRIEKCYAFTGLRPIKKGEK